MHTLNIKHVIPKDELKPIAILFISVLILAVHKSFGSIQFAYNNLPGITEFNAVIFMFISTFVLLAFLPIILIRVLFKEPLRDYGITLGNWQKGIKHVLIIFVPIAAFVLYPSIYNQEMLNFYPQSKDVIYSTGLFIKFEAIRVLLFYTGWEVFFRGFMLFGMRKYVGDAMAICIQIIPSCLWHIGMPTGEIFASIFGGIIFGVLALKTGSILYPYILHCLIGIGLDLIIILSL